MKTGKQKIWRLDQFHVAWHNHSTLPPWNVNKKWKHKSCIVKAHIAVDLVSATAQLSSWGQKGGRATDFPDQAVPVTEPAQEKRTDSAMALQSWSCVVFEGWYLWENHTHHCKSCKAQTLSCIQSSGRAQWELLIENSFKALNSRQAHICRRDGHLSKKWL